MKPKVFTPELKKKKEEMEEKLMKKAKEYFDFQKDKHKKIIY